MCGIAGAFRTGPSAIDRGVIAAMLGAIAHRGPDDEGVWHEGGAWLGQRRLSVIDLGPGGHQPMISADGRYLIVANAEIYNYRSLQAEIDAGGAIAWRGRCDVEVLVEAIARFGVAGALARAAGMFAFVAWDRQERRAWLARDRFGEKPLYYAADPKALTFASEITALERAPDIDLALDPAALSLYFCYGYIPAPLSVYGRPIGCDGGALVTWRQGEGAAVAPYWSVAAAVEAGRSDRLADPGAAVEGLDRRLRQAVAAQMVSDVPLGAFLSGGIDSSTIVAIMRAVSDRPVKTFTMGFDAPEFDEAAPAMAVARHLGTDHTSHTVTAADALDIVPDLGGLYDEPFADPSQIPTLLMCRMARRHVTVCLTGDGGDEMFGGYVRYSGVPRLWNLIRRLPLRGVVGGGLGAVPLGLANAALGFLGPTARGYASRGALGPSLRKAAGWLGAPDQQALYELTMTAWPNPDDLLVDPPATLPDWRPPAPAFDTDLDAMQWRDSIDYLPGDILVKLDRAAMSCGLETRAPFLDPAVAAFAWRAPGSMKIAPGGEAKWLLRQVLHRYVPRELIDRPKLGFSVPLHAWLSGALRGWAEELLDPAVLRRQGVLRPAPVERLWRRYLGGDSSLDHRVWTVLMFQAWQARRG